MALQQCKIVLLLLALVSVWAPAAPALAQEKGAGELEEVLSGFEEEGEKKPRASGSEVEEALEGFEKQPEEAEDREEKGGTGLEEVLEGFEPRKAGAREEPAGAPVVSLPDWLDLGGYLSLGGSLAFDHDPPAPGQPDYRWLDRLRSSFQLEAEVRLPQKWRAYAAAKAFFDWAYLIKGRETFNQPTLDRYESEVELGEAFLQGSLLPKLDIKVGRQIVVWGKFDNIRVTDILNPLDNREPGLVDIEDLRLPVAMTKLDLYLGPWDLSGMVIHEVRQNKDPTFGSDFYPFAFPPPPADRPEFGPENQEYGLALNGVFSGWDLSFYGAYVFSDQPGLAQRGQELRQVYPRIWMAGLAANAAFGSWLLKAEAAYLSGLEFFALPGEERSRLDLSLGLEYTGFRDTTLSLEVVNRHLFDYDPRLEETNEAVENEFTSAFRLTRKFMHERLELTFLATTLGLTGDGGGIQRLQAAYELTDDLILTAGLVNYMEGDRIFFQNIGDRDRVFIELKYHF